jgi:hypothetical protein
MGKTLLVYLTILFLLLLTSFNIDNYLKPKDQITREEKVLGASENGFWEDFMKENPGYIPGWVELGRVDKIMEIDPNF